MQRNAFHLLVLLALTACGTTPSTSDGSTSDAADGARDSNTSDTPSTDVTEEPSTDVVVADTTVDANNPTDVPLDSITDTPMDSVVDAPRPPDVVAEASPPDVPVDVRPDVLPDVVVPDIVMPDASATGSGLDTRPANPNCRAWARPSGPVRLARVFPRLTFNLPLGLFQAPGDRSRFFVMQKGGIIRAFSNTADPAPATVETFIDITGRVNSTPNEAGLLGMAFHPRFATNGFVYLSYTATVGGRLTSRLSRFTSMDGGRTLAPTTEMVLMEVQQPYDNHNGGDIKFGPDGYLYYALGDGGSGGDPMGNGQRLSTLLGKILRIDVNGTMPYAIPTDNPFRGMMGAREEIWAYGLRNTWRFSFDRMTGQLWAGDVGQDRLEEVDIITRGGNFGWNRMEGTNCYPPGSMCDQTGLILPVATYPRSEGVSITGGYVYRGRLLPSLVGQYLFGDYGSGRIWTLQPGAMGTYTRTQLLTGAGNISSFGEDVDGELYVLNYGNGQISQLVPGTPTMDATPMTLSATGCVNMTNPTMPAPGVIPYDVNAPLWSDGASKERFLAIPDGMRITVGANGDWDLPVGSVLVKNFTVGTQRVETRLLIRHTDGDWAGYTYAWNAMGTDATLVRGGATRTIGTTSWTFPSEAQCLQCHTVITGRTLGLETAQLNRSIVYPTTGRTANQLTTLNAIGLFTTTLPAATTLPALPTYTGTAPLQERARSYLHSNCSSCHQPNSTGRGNIDLRYTTPFAMQNLCNSVPDNNIGIMNARVIAPGSTATSVLHVRMANTGANRMPPLASAVVDMQGSTLVGDWIRALTACP